MSWKDNLQDASLRGIAFKVDSDEATFGRRVQVHEYPNRDKPWAEDLGRATRRLSVQAYLIGDDFFKQRNRLIEAIEKPGSCTLVHPYYGEMTVVVDDAVRISHSQSEGRMCRISFSFVESGELSFPTAGLATGQKLSSSVSFLDDAISSAFGAFGMDGMPDFLQDGVLDEASGMFSTVTSAFQYVDSGVSAASRLLQGDLSVLLSPPSSGMSFVNRLQTMWRAGTRLSGNAATDTDTTATATVSASSGVTTSLDNSTVISWDDLAQVRDSLNEAIDLEMERVSDDGLYQALVTVRTDVNRDISARLEQVERMTDRTPSQVTPALVLAADWYDSASRAGDITARNGIRHPGFVPVQSLRVPVR